MGILLPDIEFVLGMVGSTIGSAICIVFPSLFFIRLTNKNTTERLAAQAVLITGLCIMVLGTYVNLYEANRGPDRPYVNSNDIMIDTNERKFDEMIPAQEKVAPDHQKSPAPAPMPIVVQG